MLNKLKRILCLGAFLLAACGGEDPVTPEPEPIETRFVSVEFFECDVNTGDCSLPVELPSQTGVQYRIEIVYENADQLYGAILDGDGLLLAETGLLDLSPLSGVRNLYLRAPDAGSYLLLLELYLEGALKATSETPFELVGGGTLPERALYITQ